jgi:MFS family permease
MFDARSLSDARAASAVTVRSVYLARAIRDFADGFVAVLLPVYFTALGFTAFEIGCIATAALFGSALLTLATGFLGTSRDPRTLLLAACALMAATGFGYASLDEYWPLAILAFVGTINPSAGSASVFVPLEHAALAGAIAASDRTGAFARYSLFGALAAAAGSLAAAAPGGLATYGIEPIVAIQAMFVLYALLGAIAYVVYRRMPRTVPRKPRAATAALGPSRNIVYGLAALFSLDAFAGGLVVQSLLALWLFERFDVSLATASAFFFASGLLAAISFPLAAWLGSRIGLINTMVFTHIPSSVCLIAVAFAPSTGWAFALLLCRSALSQMDVPARASYVMAVVTADERPAAASVTAVPRSLASAASPAIAGALFAAGLSTWPLLLCGSLKILYDVVLLIAFRAIEPPEERIKH